MTVFRTGSVCSLRAWRDRASGFARLPAVALLFLLCLFSISPVGAKEGRLALVIGNSGYTEAPLRNPVNDARAMSIALRGLGFEVITVEDADQRKMQAAVLRFAQRLDGEDTGLFYYAGHGVQVDGRNYLIPLGADLPSALSVQFQAMSVESVLDAMERAGNRINLVVLDACRNNPFERRFRGVSRGLAAIDAARGTMIAYATAPGSVAADGTGRNGLYTEALLNALSVPGLKVEEVFKQVRIDVSNRSNGQQTPWESSSLTGNFFFNPTGHAAQPAVPATGTDREALFWESIKDSDYPGDFQAYLAQFPDGFFAPLARNRLRYLVEEQRETQQLALAKRPEPTQQEPKAEHAQLAQVDIENLVKRAQTILRTYESRASAREYFSWANSDRPYKVFAQGRRGNWSWNARKTYDEAFRTAMNNCAGWGSTCRLIAVGNTIVYGLSTEEREKVISSYRAQGE